MSACKTRTTLLLNWYANPYHTPIFVGKELGFYEEEGIQLAILEPNDPSDVTEIVGLGEVDFGLKAQPFAQLLPKLTILARQHNTWFTLGMLLVCLEARSFDGECAQLPS